MRGMRDFLTVFKNSFKYCWSDRMGIVMLLAFPILIIFVLGNALSGYISPEYDFEEGEKIGIAVISETNSEHNALGTFLKEINIINVIYTDNLTALELLEDGEVNIIVGTDLSVTRPPVGNLSTQIAMSVVDSYSQISAAMETAIKNGENPAELMPLIESNISVVESPLGNRVPGAIDYYAVTMLVMILMFAGTNGLNVFEKGLFSQTGARTLTTPVSKPALIGGLLAAATVTAYIQGMITFLFSWAVYGVYWGERIHLVLLTLFGVTLFSQVFAIFMILLLKSPNAAMGGMQCIIWVMTFVAGGYVKIDFGEMNNVFQYSPNSLAHTVIFGSIFGGNETKMMSDLALLFVYSAVLFILAFLLGKRRISK